ncbi:MAG: type III secretion system translocon subunit SctE [Rhizobiaceae bacterium]|nr:type III secretion system translocon subunit SctE [Rhizobiaceae bacterium]
MSSISSAGQISTDLSRLNADIAIGKAEDKAGQGIAAKGAVVPDAPAGDTRSVVASLSFFTSNTPSVDTEVLLLQVTVAMRDAEATTQKSKINTDQEAKKAEMKEKEKKLEEAQEKLEKSRSNNIFDKIKLAFEWLGAILAMVVAAVAIATGVGAVAGTLLMVGAIAALVMVVDSTVKVATGLGIAGNLVMATAESRGLSQTEAKAEAAKADMGFTISLAIVGIVAAIAGGVASSASSLQAAANAAKTTFTAAKEFGHGTMTAMKQAAMVGKEAYKMADDAAAMASTISQTAKTAKASLFAVETSVQVMTATVQGVGVGIAYETAQLKADAKVLEASAKRDEALMQMLDEMIDQALSRLMASGDRFSAMLDAITDSMQDRGNTMSRAKFGA